MKRTPLSFDDLLHPFRREQMVVPFDALLLVSITEGLESAGFLLRNDRGQIKPDLTINLAEVLLTSN